MILTKKLDASLWCMLEADEELRPNILNLVKNLSPKTILTIKEQIQDAYENGYSSSGEDIYEDGTKLECDVLMEDSRPQVTINKSITNQTSSEIKLDIEEELDLASPFSEDSYDYDDEEDIWIGSFIFKTIFSKQKGVGTFPKSLDKLFVPYFTLDRDNDSEYMGREREYEYNMIYTDGFLREITRQDNQGEIRVFLTDLRDMPEDITIEYLVSRYSEEQTDSGNYPRVRK